MSSRALSIALLGKRVNKGYKVNKKEQEDATDHVLVAGQRHDINHDTRVTAGLGFRICSLKLMGPIVSIGSSGHISSAKTERCECRSETSTKKRTRSMLHLWPSGTKFY